MTGLDLITIGSYLGAVVIVLVTIFYYNYLRDMQKMKLQVAYISFVIACKEAKMGEKEIIDFWEKSKKVLNI